MISPARVRGRTPAPRVGAIDDIIMDQGGAVQQLDDSSQANRNVFATPGVACGQQQQSGTQPFAASRKQVGSDFGDRLKGIAGLASQLALNQDQIVPYEVENLSSSEQRDGPL